ncbi:MAG: hypothetical protein ACFE92_17235 [Promethearchaeota archaeon]
MQENQNLKKVNKYIILLIYPILYIIYIISQWRYYPTSFYWSWIYVILLIEVVISMIQIFRAKIESAIILGMYPLSYIIFRLFIEFFTIGSHIHMTFAGDPPIQIFISILILQPICIIGLLFINLFMMKFKERGTYNGKILHSEKFIYHFKNWGIHFIIGFILSYLMVYVLDSLFYQLFQW